MNKMQEANAFGMNFRHCLQITFYTLSMLKNSDLNLLWYQLYNDGNMTISL